jgi:hypothetical protein
MAHSMAYFHRETEGGNRPKQGYAMPADISVRRAQPAAAVAYLGAQLQMAPKEYRDRLFGCHICGALNPTEWCHTCERDKTPFSAARPHLRAPYCIPCKALDLACRVCKAVPSTGPTDMDFAPPGWEPGQGGPPIEQVAGFI